MCHLVSSGASWRQIVSFVCGAKELHQSDTNLHRSAKIYGIYKLRLRRRTIHCPVWGPAQLAVHRCGPGAHWSNLITIITCPRHLEKQPGPKNCCPFGEGAVCRIVGSRFRKVYVQRFSKVPVVLNNIVVGYQDGHRSGSTGMREKYYPLLARKANLGSAPTSAWWR